MKKRRELYFGGPYPDDDVVYAVPADLGDGVSPVWLFHCPFCKSPHTHEVGAGRRVAHCTRQDSPYRRNGYELRLAPEAEEAS